MLPFAHEDLAIILGGYIVVNDLMPVGLVAVSIYGGMVASDFALYGIGAAARQLPWLSRFAVDDRVRRFGETLKRNVFGLVALCRVVPGVVFVAFVACGWTRVSLARFTVASLVISALYLPLMLYLVIVFGDALDDHLGLWAWPTLLVAVSATSFVRKRVFAFREASEPEAAGEAVLPATCFGMPPLARADRKVAKAERIPPLLFYAPLAAELAPARPALSFADLADRGQPERFSPAACGANRRARISSISIRRCANGSPTSWCSSATRGAGEPAGRYRPRACARSPRPASTSR